MIKNLVISTLLGLLAAAFMMDAAWQHNSQGEIHLGGTIDWSYWLLIGASWFLPVFMVSCLFGLLVVGLLRRARPKLEDAVQAVGCNRR